MNEPTSTEKRVTLSQSILGEIYDAMEGARCDVAGGLANDLKSFDDCIVSLSLKLETAKSYGRTFEMFLTERQIGRLIHELDYAGERLSEAEPATTRAMNRKIEQLKQL